MIFRKDIISDAKELQSMIDRIDLPSVAFSHPTPKDDTFKNSGIEVFVRTRPILETEDNNSAIKGVYAFPEFATSGTMTIMEPNKDVSGDLTITPRFIKCTTAFDELVDGFEFYEAVALKQIEMVAQGQSGAILFYGSTGSGKTYSTKQILEFAAEDLFSRLSLRQQVHISAIEIGQKSSIQCLFSRKPVKLAEDRFGRMNLVGANSVICPSPTEFLRACSFSLSRRRTESTGRNSVSSRTHAVIQCTVVNTDYPDDQPGILYVVDLAGNENRHDSSAHTMHHTRDAAHINATLATLKDCLRARINVGTNRHHQHAPFRQSPVTYILKDCFDAVSVRPMYLSFVATVSPLMSDMMQTLNTLRFIEALRCSKQQTKIHVDPKNPVVWDHDTAIAKLRHITQGDLNAEILLPNDCDNGLTLAKIPKEEFITLAMRGGLVKRRATSLYKLIWRMTADAHVRQRNRIVNARSGLGKQRNLEDLEANWI